MSLCPTCNQPISPLTLLVCLESNTASRLGRTAKLTPHLAIILDTLVRRSPRVTHLTHLAARLWGAEDGPTDEYNCLRVRMTQLRRVVAPLGVHIMNRHTIGYRLVLDELPAMREVA